jgi:hypothetical protein
MGQRYTPLDANLLFCEDKVLSASGVVKDGAGNDVVLNLGLGRMDASLVVDVTTLKTSTGDEKYTFLLQGADNAAFTGDKENLGVLELGAAAARTGGARASTIGRFTVPITTSDYVKSWKYVRLNLLVAGTAPSAVVTAWLAPTT